MTLEKRELENEEDRKPKKTEKTPSHARWVARVFLIAMSLCRDEPVFRRGT